MNNKYNRFLQSIFVILGLGFFTLIESKPYAYANTLTGTMLEADVAIKGSSQDAYDCGENVPLTALPNAGCGFSSLSRSTNGIDNPILMTMGAERLYVTPSNSINESSLPILDIWYGKSQMFGQPGLAQKWVNILGNASDPDGISSLAFSLNGGPTKSLSIGPDTRRLADFGDFNVEIDPLELNNGPNEVEIIATDVFSNIVSETVTVNYDSSAVWPLPYSVDWSTVTNLQDAVQIVDGQWSIGPNGVRTDTIDYDRVLAIGDLTWTDYEITVPITIHGFQVDPRDGAGLGIWLRWTGHTNKPVNCSQPHCGWLPNGGSGWYPMETDGPLSLKGKKDPSVNMDVGDTFYWKMRVETLSAAESLYSLKVWEIGQKEPTDWNITNQLSNLEPAGSAILVAHNVDATFGDITIVSLGTGPTPYSLNFNTVGIGTVTKNPNQRTYGPGTEVTLTAVAGTGWEFNNWSGDASGSGNPLMVTMDGNKNIVATFIEIPTPTHTLITNVLGKGDVTIDPEKVAYSSGEKVMLTAVPDAGWEFSGWSGDSTGNDNPLSLTMDVDKSITATFDQVKVEKTSFVPVVINQ